MKRIIEDVKILAAMLTPTWGEISARIEASGVPTMHVADRPLREQLKRVEGQLSDKREERAEKQKTFDAAKDGLASADDVSPDSEAFKSAEAARQELGEVDDAIVSLTESQTGILRMLGQGNVSEGHNRAAGDPTDPRLEWSSEHLFADQDRVERLAYLSQSKDKLGGLQLGQVASREALAADVEPTELMRRGPFRGIVPQLRRPTRVLDLIPKGTMEQNTFPYVREEGSLTGAAKGVKEGETKPEGGFTFVDDEAIARTIAEYMKIKKQALADVAALRSTIDSRLRYALELKLEAEVLAGKGTDPELDGILRASGIGVVKYTEGGELIADKVLSGITAVLLANAYANGVVANPLDWEEVLKAKAIFGEGKSGSGEYYGGGPFATTPASMWGVTLIPSPAVPKGTILVGDFTIGAQLLFREGINVLLSDSNEDDFVTNRVTMLAECRASNVIWRPPAFAKVYLTKAAEESGV